MCPICFERSEECAPTVCGHTMHPKCISDLLTRATFVEPAKCPLCRACIELRSRADELCLEGYTTDNEALLLETLKVDPLHTFAMYCLGLYYNINGRPLCAIQYFMKGMLTVPLVTGTRYYQHRLASVSCRIEMAILCHEQDMSKEASEYLSAARSAVADLGMQVSSLGLTIFSGLAAVYSDMGRFPEALYFYKRILKMEELAAPFYMEVLVAFVETLVLAKSAHAATESARLLVRLYPEPQNYFLLGQCVHTSGEAREALGLFELVRCNTVANTVLHVAAAFFTGVLLEVLNENLLASAKYRYVIQFRAHPNAAEAYIRLAAIFDTYNMPTQSAFIRAEAARL